MENREEQERQDQQPVPATQQPQQPEQTSRVPTTVEQVTAAAAQVVPVAEFSYNFGPVYVPGTSENSSMIADAAASDKLVFINAQRALWQRDYETNARVEWERVNAAGVRSGAGARGPYVPFGYFTQEAKTLLSVEPDDQERAGTPYVSNANNVVTNLYREQEVVPKEVDHYFNLILPMVKREIDAGVIKAGSLTVPEIADLIVKAGGFGAVDKDGIPVSPRYRKFMDPNRNNSYAMSLGISTSLALQKKIRELDPRFVEGARLDQEFMARRFNWDPSNQEHRDKFETWSLWKDQQEVDFTGNIAKGVAVVFAIHGDLIKGVAEGLIDPNQHISAEWLSDPAKRERVMATLAKAANVSKKAQQILGLDDTRTFTERAMGAPDPTSRGMLMLTPDRLHETLSSSGEYTAALTELAQLEREGAFSGSRFRVFTSAIDGAAQGLAGLVGLGTGFYSGTNPGGVYNNVLSAGVNIHRLVMGTRAFEEGMLDTKMKRANISRDLEIESSDWMANGMLFSGPSMYDKRQGGMGGQAIDVTRGLAKLSQLSKLMRYGATAAERVQVAARVAEEVSVLAKGGEDVLSAASTASYEAKALLSSVMREAEAAGTPISQSEAIEKIISGKVTVRGVPLTAQEMRVFAKDIDDWAKGTTAVRAEIDKVVDAMRQAAPDGTNLTASQLLEMYAGDTLPTGAGRSVWNVMEAMDPGMRKAVIGWMKRQGEVGKRILENLQPALPERGTMYGIARYVGSSHLLGGGGLSGLTGAGIGAFIGGGQGAMWGAITGTAAHAIPNWQYYVSDFLGVVGFAGNKAQLFDEYMAYSGTGTTINGSAWLKLAHDKLAEVERLKAEQVTLSEFPEKVAALQKKIDDLVDQAGAAKSWHYWTGPQSAIGAAGDVAGMTYSGGLQDIAFTLVNENMAGYGLGGTIGSTLWNKAYFDVLKRGVFGVNKDKDFARGMMELNELYKDKPDHQKAALVRVLEKAQKDGNVREVVSALVSGHIRGVETVLMPEHLASAAIYAWNEQIIGPDGKPDFSRTVEALINYGMTRDEAERYLILQRENQTASAVEKGAVVQLQSKADELSMKADDRARVLLTIREKHNASVLVAQAKFDAFKVEADKLKAVKAEYDAAVNTQNPALSNVTPELQQKLKDAEASYDAARKEAMTARRVSDSLGSRVQSEMQAIRQMRDEGRAISGQAREMAMNHRNKNIPVGGYVFSPDGRIGRRIHEGAYVFDRENGKRTIIINEEAVTRAGVLEEVFHAAEDDAVIQSIRRESVDILFGVWSKDDTGMPVQIKQPYIDTNAVDLFMQVYSDGLPMSADEKVAWFENYKVAKKHYENTGDPQLLYRYASEVMARFYVGRKIEMGIFPEKGKMTASTSAGGLEGSASYGAAGTGTDAMKLIFGDLTTKDVLDNTAFPLARKLLLAQGHTNISNDLVASYVGMFARGGVFDRLLIEGTRDYLARSGVPKQNLAGPGVSWTSGFMFDEAGNRISEPVIDSYINRFFRYMRQTDFGSAVAREESSMTIDQLGNLTPDQQVAWATKNGKQHWLTERRDGETRRLKPIAQIVAEYNRSVDSVYTSLTNAVNQNGTRMGIRVDIDENGVERLFGAPTQYGLETINQIIRKSDLPVDQQRKLIQVLAGMAGGAPDGTHPGYLPMYDIAYRAVKSDGMPDPGLKTKRYTPYGLEIVRTQIGKAGEKTGVKNLHLYLRVLDNDHINNRINLLWDGNLLGENGVELFTKAQVKSLFNSRHELAAHLSVYLQNLASAPDPTLSAGGAAATNAGKPSRSWEIFTTDASDPVAVERGKLIAEMMYRLVGTRPTKGMEGAMAGVRGKRKAGDTEKARRLMENSKDFVGESVEVKTGIMEDWMGAADDEDVVDVSGQLGGKRQDGIFRLIRIDRVESIVNTRGIYAGLNDTGMMPFSSTAYGLSQIAYGTKVAWERLDLAEVNSNRAREWWAKAPENFREAVKGKITDGYVHEGGYLVYKLGGSATWIVADTKTGTVIGSRLKDPVDGIKIASKHAIDTPQPTNNNVEFQMKNMGWFPRGLPDRADSFRGLYQNKEGFTLERKTAGKGRFTLRDPNGNIVSKDLLISVNAEAVDPAQLNAAMLQAKENARQVKALRQAIPELPDSFLEFYPVSLNVGEASARGIVAANNPVYYRVKDILNATLGPENSNFILGMMRQEMGDEAVHGDRIGTFKWVSEFFSKRVNEDPRLANRIKANYPEQVGTVMPSSMGMFNILKTMEEASLALGMKEAAMGGKPRRTLILDSVLPQARKVSEQMIENVTQQLNQEATLRRKADADKARAEKAKAEKERIAKEKAQREYKYRRMDKTALERELGRNYKEEIARQDAADAARIKLLEQLEKEGYEAMDAALKEHGELIMRAEDPKAWTGRSSLWAKARATARKFNEDKAEQWRQHRQEYVKLQEAVQKEWDTAEAARTTAEKKRIDELNEAQRLEVEAERYLERANQARLDEASRMRKEADRLKEYARRLRTQSDAKDAAIQQDWDVYRAKIALKDGYFTQLLQDAANETSSFEQSVASLSAELAKFDNEIFSTGEGLLDPNDVSRIALTNEVGRQVGNLRLESTARVNNIIGNQYGWKIAEVFIEETQPKTWVGKTMSVLEQATMGAGTPIDLQPGLPQNVIDSINYRARMNLFGGDRMGDMPEPGMLRGVLQSVASGKGPVNLVKAGIGAGRVRYLVFNPNGALVATRNSEQEALEEAAGRHRKK